MDLIYFKSYIKQYIKDNKFLSKLYSYYKILKFTIQKKSLNRNKILSKKIDTIGVSLDKRNPQIIVTLTSYPERINDSYFTIYSLLSQSLKPDKIILWLSLEEFPEKNKSLPSNLNELEKFGLTINWIPKTYYSYDKIIFALKSFPNDILITADDDIFYHKDWLKNLYSTYKESYKKNKNVIVCHRMHKITIKEGLPRPYNVWKHEIIDSSPDPLNFPTGCGGVLYPPQSLYKDVYKPEIFSQIAPLADDIWLWGMALLNNYYFITAKTCCKYKYVDVHRECNSYDIHNLKYYNITKNNNDLQLHQLLHKYPRLLTIINHRAK